MSASKRLPGSIYDGFSPAGQQALAELRAALQEAGFYAEKERRTERTLRVYPERRGRYPLLNPMLVSPRQGSPVIVRGPSIVCPVFSDGDGSITRLLETMPSINACSLTIALRRKVGRYVRHGHFTIPLHFVGSPRSQLLDFAPLGPVLAKLHIQLSRSAFLGSKAFRVSSSSG